jgi:hypothetical protein
LHYIEHDDLFEVNEAFNSPTKKRRLFQWVNASDLVNDSLPLPLFIRLKSIDNLKEIVKGLMDKFHQ